MKIVFLSLLWAFLPWLQFSLLFCAFSRGVVTIKFRALAPNGVLFYAANDLANPTYFVSLELISGRLVYKYKGQLGLLRVQTTFSNYSTGGIWYTVSLRARCVWEGRGRGVVCFVTIIDNCCLAIHQTQNLLLEIWTYTCARSIMKDLREGWAVVCSIWATDYSVFLFYATLEILSMRWSLCWDAENRYTSILEFLRGIQGACGWFPKYISCKRTGEDNKLMQYQPPISHKKSNGLPLNRTIAVYIP